MRNIYYLCLQKSYSEMNKLCWAEFVLFPVDLAGRSADPGQTPAAIVVLGYKQKLRPYGTSNEKVTRITSLPLLKNNHFTRITLLIFMTC